MKLKIEFTMDSRAFETDRKTEAVRILRDLARRIESSNGRAFNGLDSFVWDFDGETIGKAKVTK